MRTTTFLILLTLSFLTSLNISEAKKPDKPPGGGGGHASYDTLELPAPDFEITGGASPAFPEAISAVALDGTVYVVGNYDFLDGAGGTRAACWTISDAGNVVADDIGDWLWEHDLDVNSAGIISGQAAVERLPALLLPNDQVVVLASGDPQTALRLNNPDQLGVFQVVGGDVLWDVAVGGTVLGTTTLVDPFGTHLIATDINDFGEIAGYIIVDNEVIPAIGEFNVAGQLQIATYANPDTGAIATFWDFEIDNGGNLLGYGVELPGTVPRAVIWPSSGGVIDLVGEQGLNSARADGIALVDGVMQVVGTASNTGQINYLYANGQLSDLERVSEGERSWEFVRTRGVNSSGMICGYGKVGKRRNVRRHGFLLLPNSP